ncbi:StlD/DarB family beta-ketosynthase [Pleionea sediminis]|uniref:StlD/DarB family beta-ketosynthase n=1 Tax=Pleionea sediminis TaxID=2569479 RepID=UPI001185936B|nr:StlD/DarB family beta-ketosynthase [Pleionea sediminis]
MSVYENRNAYITSTGSFLPGEPVGNEEMESVLGLVNNKESIFREKILNSNGIKSRHYALDKSGNPTHLTDQLAAEAIKASVIERGCEPASLDMFAVGTTLPDILAPGIASMVHGRVGGKNADIVSTSGICGAGAAAMKAAIMSVISGQHKRVVACGTERPSAIMRGSRFEKESEVEQDRNGVAKSYQYFNADFLRWMLSDGAGAVIIDDEPKAEGLSLNVEWIETCSFANKLDTCMYMGVNNPNEMTPQNTWVENIDKDKVLDPGILLLRQDTRLLNENIIKLAVDFAVEVKEKHGLPDVDWFLPHISSFYFHEKLSTAYQERGINIPLDKWFTNLERKGNTGSASIFIMLDELFQSGKIKDGEKVLLMIPESGRFSFTYVLLTAVVR